MHHRIVWLLILQVIGLNVLLLAQAKISNATFVCLLWVGFIASAAYLLFDHWVGVRLLRWLQQRNLHTRPLTYSLWADMADGNTRKQIRLQRETAQANKKLTEFLEAMRALPIGLVLLDHEGRMEWFNPTASDHFGFVSPDDSKQQIIHLVRNPKFIHYWLQPQENNTGVTIYGHRHSAQHPIKLALQYVDFGEGKRLLLSRNVTALEQAERMRRDFVSNVSHEIRTPLTVLAGFVETILTLKLTPEETTRYLGLMGEQAQRMQVLVEDLLTLSRLEGSPPPDSAERIDVYSLLQACFDDAQALSRALGVNTLMHQFVLDVNVTEGLKLSGSTQEVRSAISNLLSNAVRYTPQGKKITLQAELTEKEDLRIAVRDTGAGIAPEHLTRLTERFYRIDKSRSRETGGTGLGLAIVKHVAQRHHARFNIESTLGEGSSFILLFAEHRLSTPKKKPYVLSTQKQRVE